MTSLCRVSIPSSPSIHPTTCTRYALISSTPDASQGYDHVSFYIFAVPESKQASKLQFSAVLYTYAGSEEEKSVLPVFPNLFLQCSVSNYVLQYTLFGPVARLHLKRPKDGIS